MPSERSEKSAEDNLECWLSSDVNIQKQKFLKAAARLGGWRVHYDREGLTIPGAHKGKSVGRDFVIQREFVTILRSLSLLQQN